MEFESVFVANPNVNVIYGFKDGNAFIDKRQAENYANQTKQKFEIIEKSEDKPKKNK